MKTQVPMSADQKAVQQVIMDVLESDSIYNVERLDHLYSDGMQITRVSRDGSTITMGKEQLLQFLMDKRARNTANSRPLRANTDFHHIEVNGEQAQVLMTREMKLLGTQERTLYSICLTKMNRHWKVVKETLVART